MARGSFPAPPPIYSALFDVSLAAELCRQGTGQSLAVLTRPPRTRNQSLLASGKTVRSRLRPWALPAQRLTLRRAIGDVCPDPAKTRRRGATIVKWQHSDHRQSLYQSKRQAAGKRQSNQERTNFPIHISDLPICACCIFNLKGKMPRPLCRSPGGHVVKHAQGAKNGALATGPSNEPVIFAHARQLAFGSTHRPPRA